MEPSPEATLPRCYICVCVNGRVEKVRGQRGSCDLLNSLLLEQAASRRSLFLISFMWINGFKAVFSPGRFP